MMASSLENISPDYAAGATASERPSVTVDGTGNFKEMFSELLQERRDNLKDTLDELAQKRQEQRELQDMQQVTEVIRRIMPDGSILVTEYKDGKIAGRYRKKPHLVEVRDPNVAPPRNSDGNIIEYQQEMKAVPKFSIFEGL